MFIICTWQSSPAYGNNRHGDCRHPAFLSKVVVLKHLMCLMVLMGEKGDKLHPVTVSRYDVMSVVCPLTQLFKSPTTFLHPNVCIALEVLCD